MSIQGLENVIYSIHNIEKYIAVKNDRVAAHLKKWKAKAQDIEFVDYMAEYVLEMEN